MVSTSGAQLLPNADAKTLRMKLLPLATVLTPNIPEAKLLLKVDGTSNYEDDFEINNVLDLEEMARRVRALGPEWVLLKGGHVPFTKDLKVAESTTAAEDKRVVDILCGPGSIIRIESRFQDSTSTHGTGCTLACKFRRPLSSLSTSTVKVRSVYHTGN
jgi:hydroxymethylpyrimidine/phosphomethylpyrimidine kinase